MPTPKSVQAKASFPVSVADAVTLQMCDIADLAGLLSEIHQLKEVDSPTLLAGVSAIGRVIGEKAERIGTVLAPE